MFKKEMGRWLLALAGLLFFSSYCNAQVSTNCVPSTDGTINPLTGTQCLDPVDNTIKQILDQGDFGTGRHNTGKSQNQQYNNYTGSTLTSTDYILHFSHTNDTWVTNMAINQALAGAGFNIGGYAAQWDWKNENINTINGACNVTKVNGDCLDDLVITIDAYASGINIYSEEWDYSQTKSNGWTVEDVLTFSPLALVPGLTIDEIEVTIRGVDNGYWQGMYGPKVQNMTGSVILMPDNCTLNGPLSDPSCPGYANALFQQQCTQNPLYDPSCPGYATAYLNQQCAISVLYDPSCPGYQTAYYNQQCTNDPLSDPGCPDYFVAQCEKNPLYDMGCIGYDTAYFDQQCGLDAQYNTMCPGYVDLSGNDGDFTVLDPIVDDVVNAEVQTELFEPEIPVYTQTYTEEIVEVEPEAIEIDEYQQVLEDDIEREIAELENEGDAMNMEDDIEKEIAQLEDSTSSENDFDDPTNAGGKKVMEDDIEKEIAELEQESDTSEGDSESTLEDGVQVASSNEGPNKVGDATKNSKRENVLSPDASKRQKIKWLIAQKAIEATKELENAVTLEQQMNIQRRLLALISFVPDFSDYGEKENVNQVNFYPPKPTVDHAYARWFLNDPNFGAMENLQYPNLR
jgi:hypothetical protein